MKNVEIHCVRIKSYPFKKVDKSGEVNLVITIWKIKPRPRLVNDGPCRDNCRRLTSDQASAPPASRHLSPPSPPPPLPPSLASDLVSSVGQRSRLSVITGAVHPWRPRAVSILGTGLAKGHRPPRARGIKTLGTQSSELVDIMSDTALTTYHKNKINMIFLQCSSNVYVGNWLKRKKIVFLICFGGAVF